MGFGSFAKKASGFLTGGGNGGWQGPNPEDIKRQKEEDRNRLEILMNSRPQYGSIIANPEFADMKKYAYGDESSKSYLLRKDELAKQMTQQLEDQDTSQAGAAANAYSQLAQDGGLSSGSRERVAASLGDTGLLAKQGLRRANTMGNVELGKAEEDQRFARQSELQAAMQRDAELQNADKQSAFQQKLMGEMGIDKAAEMKMTGATTGSSTGCCFIFLEARYGNGTMDRVVRKYRDEHMTELNRRGYYKLSEVLVPAMRASKLVKFAVRVLLTDPLVAYGNWHYNRKGLGWMFKPLKDFWLKTFNVLGSEHKFIRENGEVV